MVEIASGISEDDQEDSYLWDTSMIPDGQYHILAWIDDGVSEIEEECPGTVRIEHQGDGNGEEPGDGDDEHDRACRLQRGGRHQRAPSADLVGKRAGQWRDHEHEDGLDEGDAAELRCRASQLVDKPEQRDPLNPAAKLESHAGEQQQSKRTESDRVAGGASRLLGGIGHRYL